MSKTRKLNTNGLYEKLAEIFDTPADRGVLQGNRKINKGRTGTRINFLPSLKNKAMMPCESRLEADSCLELEFNQSVVAYRVQPFTIQISAKETYTPDSIHRDTLGGYTVREVKVSSKLKDEILIKRLARICNIFINIGIGFEVKTETDLQCDPESINRKYLYRSSHFPINDFVKNRALKILKIIGKTTLLEFRKSLSQHNIDPVVAEKLLFLGLVEYDCTKSLTPMSEIWLKGEKS